MAHRIEVTGRVDYPDGSTRVMFACHADGCCTGHVEGDPAVVADVVVARLVESHREADDMLPGPAEHVAAYNLADHRRADGPHG